MAVESREIVKFCEDYLNVKDINDSCVNGLQVEGRAEINEIITGVSLSEQLIKQAIAKQAEMIMVHHGIFEEHLGCPPVIKGIIRKRIKLLLENDINLCGFHLPLDLHPEIGNSISLVKALGLKKIDQLQSHLYGPVGFLGQLKEPKSFNDFVAFVNVQLATNSYIIAAGTQKVNKVGIISGGASPEFQSALEAGADTYITGDIRESVVRAVEEAKINFINAGHYNTEKLGIQNLGKLIAEKFKIEVEFVDIPCDI